MTVLEKLVRIGNLDESSETSVWPKGDRVLLSLMPEMRNDLVNFHAGIGKDLNSMLRPEQIRRLDENLTKEALYVEQLSNQLKVPAMSSKEALAFYSDVTTKRLVIANNVEPHLNRKLNLGLSITLGRQNLISFLTTAMLDQLGLVVSQIDTASVIVTYNDKLDSLIKPSQLGTNAT